MSIHIDCVLVQFVGTYLEDVLLAWLTYPVSCPGSFSG